MPTFNTTVTAGNLDEQGSIILAAAGTAHFHQTVPEKLSMAKTEKGYSWVLHNLPQTANASWQKIRLC